MGKRGASSNEVVWARGLRVDVANTDGMVIGRDRVLIRVYRLQILHGLFSVSGVSGFFFWVFRDFRVFFWVFRVFFLYAGCLGFFGYLEYQGYLGFSGLLVSISGRKSH